MSRRIIFSALFTLATTSLVAQDYSTGQCHPSSFNVNGLYYSATGSPNDATRIIMPFSPGIDQSKILSLTGANRLEYSSSGRFFLRSGVGNAPWLNIDTSASNEAILVKRQTNSSEALVPEFINVFRSTLPTDLCPKDNRSQFSDERNFIAQGAFIRYHQAGVNNRTTGELSRSFHFAFRNGSVSCVRTDDPISVNGTDVSALAYNGDIFDVRTSGGQFIEQTAVEIASVILPKPAYADQAERQRIQQEDGLLNITSVEATLFHAAQKADLCVTWPVPIPTVKAGGFWTKLFDNRDRHRDAAAELFDKGSWSPQVTEVFIYRVAAQLPAGVLRLYWK